MQGSTHKIIAPLFTAGVATAYLRTNPIDSPLGTVVTVAIAAAASYASACWPDADQHAKYMPLPVIWAGFLPPIDSALRARGVKIVRLKKKPKSRRQSRTKKEKPKRFIIYNQKKYPIIHSPVTRIWASIFRIVGLRKHRDWRSHSPLVWIPIWYILFLRASLSPYVNVLLAPVVMGFGLGYISHIVGDAFTLSGIPFLPDSNIVEKIPVVNHFTDIKIFRGKAFKASNKIWNFIVILIIGYGALFVIDNEVAMLIFEHIKGLVLTLFDFAFMR